MANISITKEILEELNSLALEDQREVLDFTRFLISRKETGVQGRELLHFAGKIDKSDLG